MQLRRIDPESMVPPQLREKYFRLQSLLNELGSVVIGYSGGVDSTLLLRVATDVLGPRALAVIGKSETYPTSEYEEAVRIAQVFGAQFIEVTTEETDDLKFQSNPLNRCYYCKTELFSKLSAIAEKYDIEWIADGTITDDLNDFRPGMQAKKEQRVRSPLLEAGFSKQDVRELSRWLGLPTWNKQSFACLSSRFPYGQAITKESLMKIDRAESVLRDLGFRYFRVRHHDENTARIEVGKHEIARMFDDTVREELVTRLKMLGFTYVTLDLQGYRTGSMNEVIRVEGKNELTRIDV